MSARKAREPGPKGFVWKGIELLPVAGHGPSLAVYASEEIEVGDRLASWRVERTPGGWHARLKIGPDRFPGVGKTAGEALEGASTEAANVATYIVAMLPPASSPRASKKRARRARKAAR